MHPVANPAKRTIVSIPSQRYGRYARLLRMTTFPVSVTKAEKGRRFERVREAHAAGEGVP